MKIKRKIINVIRKINNFLQLRLYYKISSDRSGYNIFGYISRISGQGEVVRSYVDHLVDVRQEFTLLDFLDVNHESISREELWKYLGFHRKNLEHKNNIFFVDLMALRRFKSRFPIFFINKHNIVVFWWEFESGFEDRIEILNEFDEVYVFSDFIKSILESVESRNFKVTKIDYHLKQNWLIEQSPELIREKYSLSGRFAFFFNFDYTSSYYRKNPEAILQAVSEEFISDENVVIIFKTNNSGTYPEQESLFNDSIRKYKMSNKVVIVRESLTRNGFMSLLNAMDCYVSLHRGEGLGLGILEALSVGKPVIATNYGGNTEYMANELAYPVSYTMVPAKHDHDAYRSVKLWAEPDIQDARKCMRQVFLRFNQN